MYTSESSTCRLLDLPVELLHECMPTRDSLPSTFAVCRKLFSLQCGSLRMRQAVGEDADSKRAALVRMMQSFPSLKRLGVHFDQGLTDEVLKRFVSPSPGPGFYALAGIVDMTITAPTQNVDAQAHLSSLIPQCVAQACPKLVKLTLCGLRMQQQQQQPAILSELQQLVLDHCVIDMTRDLVEQQLQAAPHLQYLKLMTDDVDTINNLSSRVNELEFDGQDWDENKHAWAFSAVQQPCLMLRKLVAKQLLIHDGMIEDFLAAMPNVEQLDVHEVHIVQDWSKELTCRWKQLSFISVPDYASLAFLPVSSQGPMRLSFHGTQRIEVRTSNRAVDPWDCPKHLQPGVKVWLKHTPTLWIRKQEHWGDEWDLQLSTKALTMAQQAGGFTYIGNGIPQAVFTVPRPEPPVIHQILIHVFCMFNHLQHVVLKGNIHVNTELLTVVGQSSMCKHLEFADVDDLPLWPDDVPAKCKFQDGIWGSIVDLLPQVTELSLCCSEVTAQHLKVLCTAATRAIKVRVMHSAWCMDAETRCGMVTLELGESSDLARCG